MPFTSDVVAIWVEAGVGQAGADLFIGPRAKVPPDSRSWVITQAPGQGPEGTHNSVDAPAYERPSGQVVCRAPLYADAEAGARLAYSALFKVRNRFVAGTWWRQVVISQEPFPLGEEDGLSLIRFVFNFYCVKRLSPATS